MPDALTSGANDALRLLRGGSYSYSRDVLKHRVYDSRYFAATISDYTFFSQNIGSAWRVGSKTLAETNMYDSGKLPAGQAFVVNRMGIACISFSALTVTDAEKTTQAFLNLLQSSVFEIKIQGREWDYQIPGSQFCPMPLAITLAGTANSIRVGDCITTGWSKLDPTPIVIDNQVGFSVIHRLNNPDTNIVTVLNASASNISTKNVTMMVILEGVLSRAK